MKKTIVLYCLVSSIILFLAGCKEDERLSSIREENMTSPIEVEEVSATPKVITESHLYMGEQGEIAKLQLVLTDGRYIEEDPLSPYFSGGYMGEFELRVLDEEQQVQSKLYLNDLFQEQQLFFRSSFDILFHDYNNDGAVDFTLGQYGTSNGFFYRLFTVTSVGKLKPLEIEEDSILFCDSQGYSARFRKTKNNAFSIRWYSQEEGAYFIRSIEWEGDKFIRGEAKREELEDICES